MRDRIPVPQPNRHTFNLKATSDFKDLSYRSLIKISVIIYIVITLARGENMCVLQYRVVYVDNDKNWKEILITVEEDTIEAALLKYLETLGEISKPIKVSELLQIENN